MEEIKEFIKEHKTIVLIVFEIVIIVFLITGELFLYTKLKNQKPQIIKELVTKETQKEEESEEKPDPIEYVYIDIKGEVNKPGMYKLEKGKRVWDAIEKAGGLTKNASTKPNNLGKELIDEMVIIIYNKEQIKSFEEIKDQEQQLEEICNTKELNIKNDSCILKENLENQNEEYETQINEEEQEENIDEENQELININTATKEELMTLTGIGESKALEIIEYRNITTFISIEEIKNVPGIGDSIYDKIKENITT